MTKSEKSKLAKKLRAILDREDMDSDGLITRKPSKKHEDNLDVLIQHISILIKDFRFDKEATRRELSEIRQLLDELN